MRSREMLLDFHFLFGKIAIAQEMTNLQQKNII